MTQHKADLLVIGAGPGGFAAALGAAKGGLSVVLAEKSDLGGTCLNWGCIPTKLLLGATAAVDELAAQTRLRIAAGEVRIDLAALQGKKDKMLAATRKAMEQRLATEGVTLLRGQARFLGPHTASVSAGGESTEVDFQAAIIATGSKATFFPGLEPDGERILDSDAALALTTPPKSLLVIGGGFIGIEMAQAFHRMGSSITMLDAAPRIAPQEDPEVSAELMKIFKRQGWKIMPGARVKSLQSRDGQALCTLESGEALAADFALVAVGRGPVSEGLGLDILGARRSERGYIETDGFLQAAPRIYALGDVNGRFLLAHAAEHQAHYVVRHLLGKTGESYAPGPMPSCVYGSPETMRVGALAEELKEAGGRVEVSRFNLAANPIAQAHGAVNGFVKVVWSEDKVAGVTAVGFGVSQLLTLSEVMVAQGWSREQVEEMIFPHPSLDEALLEALRAERSPA